MDIFNRDNTILVKDVALTRAAEHEVGLMKSDLVRLSWNDAECVTIPAGAYIIPFDDDDVRYTIYEDYVPEETSNGFKYEPQFESPVMWLGYVPFTFKTKDAAGADANKTDYPYVGRLSEILTQYVTLINAEFSKRWYEQYHETFEGFYLGYYIGFDNTKTISVSFSDNDCLSALALICEAAECEYHFDWSTRELSIGEKITENPVGSDYIYGSGDDRWLNLEIGDNVNEPSISRSKNPVYNRYIVLGSTRNNIRKTENDHWIATSERLTLDTNTYPDSIIDLRHVSPYTPSSDWKTDMEKVPATTGIMTFDDIYPHRDLYIYDLHERKKYKTDENGYPTTERWSVWYFKLAYKNGSGEWKDFKLIGSSPNGQQDNLFLTCKAESIETSDEEVTGYVTSLPWGDYFKSIEDTDNPKRTQKYCVVVFNIGGHDRGYNVGVKNQNGNVMLCHYTTGFNAKIGREDQFDQVVEGGFIHVNDTLRLANTDLSKAPSENRTDYRVDGLVPTLAFQVNDSQNALTSPMGMREFEVEYHTDAVEFNLDDDVAGQTGIDAGYYEIIHTTEGNDLIIPTTFEQKICPQSVSGTKLSDLGDTLLRSNKGFLFNIQVDDEMVSSAKVELRDEAVKAVANLAVDNNTYTFQCNPVTLEDDISYSDRYKVGIRTRFVLGDGYEYFGRILSVKTKLDYSFCKEITVGNAVQNGRNSRIISELKKQAATIGTGGVGGGGNGSVNPADIASIGRDLFLSKTYEDETEYLVSFLGGLMVDGYLKSPQYTEGEWEKIKDGDEDFFVWTKKHTGKGLGVYEDNDGGWHIELDYATIRKMLRTKELESLKAFFGSEDYYNPKESVLAVQGNAEFSHHLSSTEFKSGFIGGKGWAIKRVEFTNALGEPETRYTLEIDNITVRNTLRVYEMIISQLRGENDNYLFAAMAEVHHYDPETGKVWLSTEGGKIYMPFCKGDYIMVQRYQPGNAGISGKDGYVTKSYELVIVDTGTGGQEDENGDRLDWVIFKNFTTQMLHDVDSPYYHPAEGDEGDYYHTEEQIEARRNAVKTYIRSQHPEYSDLTLEDKTDEEMATNVYLLPVDLIDKGDTFCRIDNESDPERKGIIGITSVGPDTPYMDIMYGRKTDPNNFLKGRIGNLEGIKSEQFGWLEGFGAYLINLYSVGHFKNAQTGEAMESRIEATNERLHSAFREKGYDINENDNKVSNGFFQNGLDDWTPCDLYGTPLSDPAEMEYENGQWVMKHSDGFEAYSICSETVNGERGDNLLMNGLQLEIQKTENVEITTTEGVQVLHLNNAGVVQDFSVMTANTAHKKLTVDDDEFEDPTKPETQQPEYEKCTYQYNENFQREELRRQGYSEYEIDQVITTPPFVEAINAWVEYYKSQCQQQVEYLSSAEYEVDKLYVGVRILPLTGGMLRVRFINSSAQEYDEWSVQCEPAVNWSIQTGNDHPEEGQEDTWYFPIDIDEQPRNGKFLVSYDGECYIRFVVLQNDPIDEEEHEYETLFEQNARRIRMQAKYDDKQFADWVIQYNAIIQRVTDNKHLADQALEDILGIKTNPDGTYEFPDDWFDPNYTYASWIIHTKNRMDFLFTKWDDDNNLVAYSDRTQTADFINEIIAATNEGRDIAQEYKTMWGNVSNTLHQTFNDFNDAWGDALDDGVLTAEELARLKSLYRSLTDMFNSAKEAKDTILQSEYIKDLTNSQSPKKDINDKWTALNTAYNNMDAVYNQVLEIPAGSTIDEATMKNKNLISSLNAALTAFDTALKNFDNVIFNARNYVSSELAKATKAVKDKYETDQAALDQAIKDAYQDQNVNFLSFVNDTAWSSIQAKAIFDNNGKILKDSIRTQTAELIEDAISDYGNGQFSDVTQYANGFEHFVVSLANAKESEYDYKAYKEVQESLNSFLEDNVINKSEYEAIKSLRKSLETEYKDVVSTYVKIYSDANLSASAKTALQTAYNALVAAYGTSTASSKTGAIGAIDTLIEAYESAITTQGTTKEYVRVSDATKNNVNTALATFNARMEDYKNALDTASGDINKAVAQGLVDQLKGNIDPGVLKGDPNYDYATFKTETSYGFETIAGAFDPTTKKLEKISTWVQTAEGFEQEVKDARGGESSLKVRIDGINTTVTNNYTAADTAIKNIRLNLYGNEEATTGQNGSLATWFTQEHDKIDLIAGKFDANGNPTVASGIVVANGNDNNFSTLFAASYNTERIEIADTDSWESGAYSYGSKVVDGSQIRTKNLIPVNIGTVFFLNSGYTLNICCFNSSKSYLSQTGYKSPDDYGRIVFTTTNVAYVGLTINTTLGNLSKTGIYQSDTKEATRGEIGVFVDNFGTTDAKIKADNITFTFTNASTWYWKNKATNEQTKIMEVKSTGLEVFGQVAATQTNFQANNVTLIDNSAGTGGNLILENSKQIKWKTTAGTAISMLTLDNSTTNGTVNNHFVVGEQMVTQGLTTCIRGKNIRFQTTGTWDENAYIDENGKLKVTKLQIGSATFEWVTGKGLQVNQDFYSTGSVAAYGAGSTSGGGGGVDINISTFGVVSGKTLRLTISGQTKDADLSSMFTGIGGNTAGALDNHGTKLYLIGASEQASNPVTNTNSGCYIDANGNLYSNSSKTVTETSIGSLATDIGVAKANSAIFVSDASGGKKVGLNADNNRGVYDWTASKWLVGSNGTNTWLSIGNVGIGTSLPTSKLQVSGNAAVNSLILGQDEGIGTYSISTKDSDACINLSAQSVHVGASSIPDSVTVDPKFYVNGIGYFSGDLYSNGNKVLTEGSGGGGAFTGGDISSHLYMTGAKASSSTGNTSQIVFGTSSDNHVAISSNTDAVIINPSTSTTTNQIILGVNGVQSVFNGTLRVKSAVTFDSTLSVLSIGTTGISNATSPLTVQNNSKDLQLGSSSNHVGIGTAADTNYKLKVSGSSLFDGNVGIGGYNSGYKLYVSGTASISQSLSVYGMEITKNNGVYEINTDDISVYTDADWYGYWKSASDINKKDWVENIEVSVEDVARTPIFAFTWKDKPQRGIYMGTSAQYIQTVFPYAVDVLEDGTLAMDYGATALAAAVMTARTVLTHEQRIAALEAENERLRNEINELKAA